MQSRLLAHLSAVAATLLFTATCAAHAFIAIPVSLINLDPGVRNIGFGCELVDSVGQRVGGGGLPFISVRRGGLETEVRIPIHRTVAGTAPVARYICKANVYGTRTDGVSYLFQTGLRVNSDGWRGESWGWPGDGVSVIRILAMMPRAGSRPQLIISGDVPPGIARLFTEVEVPDPNACPCGCGASGSDGAACNTRQGADWLNGVYLPARRPPSSSAPAAPPPPAKKSQATIVSESRRLGLDRRTTVPIPGSGSFPPSFTTTRLEFVGVGMSVLSR